MSPRTGNLDEPLLQKNSVDVLSDNRKIVDLSLGAIVKTLLVSGVGNLLEWYDFQIYAYFATEIGTNFFPETNKTSQIVASFGVFGGAFFMRPLGGFLFGYISDKYGRLYSLRISIIMMAIPTVMMVLMPTYKDIGLWATILLTLIRLTQGLSVGGELIGAMTYVCEITPKKHHGLAGSLVQASSITGMLLASLVASILKYALTPEKVTRWGWRIPYAFGLLIIILGVFFRNSLKETHEYNQVTIRSRKSTEAFTAKKQLKQVILGSWKEMLTIMGLEFFLTTFYVYWIWAPTYLTELRTDPLDRRVFVVNTCCLLLIMLSIVISGAVGDFFGWRLISGLGVVLVMCFSPVAWWIMSDKNIWWCAGVQGFLAFGFGLYNGLLPALFVSALPDVSTRCTILGAAYNLCMLLGGLSPTFASLMANNALFGQGTEWIAISGYCGILGAVSFFTIVVLPYLKCCCATTKGNCDKEQMR